MLIDHHTEYKTEYAKNRIKQAVNSDIRGICVKDILRYYGSEKIDESGSQRIDNALYRGNIRPLLRIGRKNVNEILIGIIKEIIEEMKQKIEHQNNCALYNISF